MAYISIPTVVEAVQWTGQNVKEVSDFFHAIDPVELANLNFSFDDELEVWNYLEEQWIRVPIGHWVIYGSKAEMYPCENGVFEARYKAIRA